MQQFAPFESHSNVQAPMPTPQGICALIEGDENSLLEHYLPHQENQASVGLIGWSKPIIKSSTLPLKKPKRILNAYNLFFKYHKQLIQEDIRLGRKVGYGNLARVIACRWRKAGPEEKAHFTHLYKLDKKRHEREMKAWNVNRQFQKVTPEEEEQAICVEPLPFEDFFDEVDSNPYLVDPINVQRLAHNLGEECTEAFIRAFLY
uniref:HMG box domain-containing protein n=1 Tax=Amphora coffeiformis TaxID=265554 RepID=A0A7S3P442_9STRA|mmetsp:Transcript_6563/g.13532  ORF Transcript_6563/g.13532 Transcript_6563/m.13532 type:complete len:204 (+) Transcript_6563:190-801(+)